MNLFKKHGVSLSLFVISLFCAGWFCTALTWDGAYILFRTLNDEKLFIAHGRVANLPFLAPILWGMHASFEGVTLARIYGWSCSLIPLGCLIGILWSLKKNPPRQSIAAIGFFCSILPGIMCPTMEAMPALYLFWLAIAMGWSVEIHLESGQKTRSVIMGILGLLAAVGGILFHPVAAPLLISGAALILLERKLKGASLSWKHGLIPSLFILIAVAKLSHTIYHRSPYETSQFSPDIIFMETFHAFFGTPMMFLPCALILMVYCLIQPEFIQTRTCRFLTLLVILVPTLLSLHPFLWSGALNYRKMVLVGGFVFASVPCLLLLKQRMVARKGTSPLESPLPTLPVLPAALFFSLALIASSFSWHHLVTKTLQSFRLQPHRLVQRDQMPQIHYTVLDHWGAVPGLLILQGKKPEYLPALQPGKIENGRLYILFNDRGHSLKRHEGTWSDLTLFKDLPDQAFPYPDT